MDDNSSRVAELKQKFIDERGYWAPFWDDLCRLDPEYFEAYLNLSAIPWKNGTIPAKYKEFIYIALDASTTHLYEIGLRVHIRNALRYGATQEEILEVLEMVSGLGIHACTMGVPVLVEEVAAFTSEAE